MQNFFKRRNKNLTEKENGSKNTDMVNEIVDDYIKTEKTEKNAKKSKAINADGTVAEQNWHDLMKEYDSFKENYFTNPKEDPSTPDKIFIKNMSELEDMVTEHIPKKVVEDEIVIKRIVEEDAAVKPLDFEAVREAPGTTEYSNKMFEASEKGNEDDLADFFSNDGVKSRSHKVKSRTIGQHDILLNLEKKESDTTDALSSAVDDFDGDTDENVDGGGVEGGGGAEKVVPESDIESSILDYLFSAEGRSEPTGGSSSDKSNSGSGENASLNNRVFLFSKSEDEKTKNKSEGTANDSSLKKRKTQEKEYDSSNSLDFFKESSQFNDIQSGSGLQIASSEKLSDFPNSSDDLIDENTILSESGAQTKSGNESDDSSFSQLLDQLMNSQAGSAMSEVDNSEKTGAPTGETKAALKNKIFVKKANESSELDKEQQPTIDDTFINKQKIERKRKEIVDEVGEVEIITEEFDTNFVKENIKVVEDENAEEVEKVYLKKQKTTKKDASAEQESSKIEVSKHADSAADSADTDDSENEQKTDNETSVNTEIVGKSDGGEDDIITFFETDSTSKIGDTNKGYTSVSTELGADSDGVADNPTSGFSGETEISFVSENEHGTDATVRFESESSVSTEANTTFSEDSYFEVGVGHTAEDHADMKTEIHIEENDQAGKAFSAAESFDGDHGDSSKVGGGQDVDDKQSKGTVSNHSNEPGNDEIDSESTGSESTGSESTGSESTDEKSATLLNNFDEEQPVQIVQNVAEKHFYPIEKPVIVKEEVEIEKDRYILIPTVSNTASKQEDKSENADFGDEISEEHSGSNAISDLVSAENENTEDEAMALTGKDKVGNKTENNEIITSGDGAEDGENIAKDAKVFDGGDDSVLVVANPEIIADESTKSKKKRRRRRRRKPTDSTAEANVVEITDEQTDIKIVSSDLAPKNAEKIQVKAEETVFASGDELPVITDYAPAEKLATSATNEEDVSYEDFFTETTKKVKQKDSDSDDLFEDFISQLGAGSNSSESVSTFNRSDSAPSHEKSDDEGISFFEDFTEKVNFSDDSSENEHDSSDGDDKLRHLINSFDRDSVPETGISENSGGKADAIRYASVDMDNFEDMSFDANPSNTAMNYDNISLVTTDESVATGESIVVPSKKVKKEKSFLRKLIEKIKEILFKSRGKKDEKLPEENIHIDNTDDSDQFVQPVQDEQTIYDDMAQQNDEFMPEIMPAQEDYDALANEFMQSLDELKDKNQMLQNEEVQSSESDYDAEYGGEVIDTITVNGIILGNLSGYNVVLTEHAVVRKDIDAENDVLCGENSVVNGSIRAKKIVVDGVVRGDIFASDLVEIRNGAMVFGNISSSNVMLSEEAIVKGNIIYIK